MSASWRHLGLDRFWDRSILWRGKRQSLLSELCRCFLVQNLCGFHAFVGVNLGTAYKNWKDNGLLFITERRHGQRNLYGHPFLYRRKQNLTNLGAGKIKVLSCDGMKMAFIDDFKAKMNLERFQNPSEKNGLVHPHPGRSHVNFWPGRSG
jgi:hypothetical protein